MPRTINHEMEDLRSRNKNLARALDDTEDELESATAALLAYRFLAMLGWLAFTAILAYELFGNQ